MNFVLNFLNKRELPEGANFRFAIYLTFRTTAVI